MRSRDVGQLRNETISYLRSLADDLENGSIVVLDSVVTVEEIHPESKGRKAFAVYTPGGPGVYALRTRFRIRTGSELASDNIIDAHYNATLVAPRGTNQKEG